MEKQKARLIAKGYNQKKGLNCFNTYSLVAKIFILRTLLVITFIYKLIIHQKDMKIMFLNVDLDKEIYME